MELPFENLKNRFLSLSPDLQDAISSVEVAQHFYEIGQENGLHVDEMGDVAQETGLVFLGLTHPNEYIAKLLQHLPNLDRSRVEKIAKEVNEKIFGPVREQLTALHRNQTGAEAPKAISVPPAVTMPPETPATPMQGPPQGISRVMQNDIAKTKLEQSFRIPPEATTVTLPQTEARSANQELSRKEIDPYKEPIN